MSPEVSHQRRRTQLHAAIKLIEAVDSMLGYIRALADVAVVEITENGFALDVYARVSDLPVPLLLETAESSLRPVAAALIRTQLKFFVCVNVMLAVFAGVAATFARFPQASVFCT